MLFHFGTDFKIHLKARGLCWTATLDHKLPQTADNTTLHWGANIPISLLKQETVLLKKNKKTISYSLHFLLWTSLCARNFWNMFELAYFLQDELYLNVLYILIPPWLGNAVADLHGQYYSNPKKVPNDIYLVPNPPFSTCSMACSGCECSHISRPWNDQCRHTQSSWKKVCANTVPAHVIG